MDIWTYVGPEDLQVIEPTSDLAKRVRMQMRKQRSHKSNQYRNVARTLASEGTLEIDDNATVSISADMGAYVQAWLWVDESDVRAAGRSVLG